MVLVSVTLDGGVTLKTWLGAIGSICTAFTERVDVAQIVDSTNRCLHILQSSVAIFALSGRPLERVYH